MQGYSVITPPLWSICGAGKLHSFLDATQKSHLHLVFFFSFDLGDIIISCALEKKLSFFLLHAKGQKKLPHVAFLNTTFEKRPKVATFTLGSQFCH
jgi:hypothetical protein